MPAGNREKLRKVTTANQIISATAVASTAGGITTAITVVGLPITVTCSVISGVTRVTSISLTAYSKALHDVLKKRSELLLREAKFKLQMMQGSELYNNVLSKEDMKRAEYDSWIVGKVIDVARPAESKTSMAVSRWLQRKSRIEFTIKVDVNIRCDNNDA